MKLYQEIARTIDAFQACARKGNTQWIDSHGGRLEELVSMLPSGSGWDHGTTLDMERSSPNRLVFRGAYHHMDDGGSYDGWTEHLVVVTADLAFGFRLGITGRNRNEIKGYLGAIFHEALSQEVLEK